MPDLLTPDGVCVSADGGPDSRDLPCQGDVEVYTSTSGVTAAHRCERHGGFYLDRMEELRADVQSRYPGWDTPGSPPPPWFDPADAGESWDEP